MRAQCEIRPLSNGKEEIVVTEIPYQVNKSRMISGIAELVKDKKIEGIADIKDHSDRNGINITIECKKDYKSRTSNSVKCPEKRAVRTNGNFKSISTHSYRKLTA